MDSRWIPQCLVPCFLCIDFVFRAAFSPIVRCRLCISIDQLIKQL